MTPRRTAGRSPGLLVVTAAAAALSLALAACGSQLDADEVRGVSAGTTGTGGDVVAADGSVVPGDAPAGDPAAGDPGAGTDPGTTGDVGGPGGEAPDDGEAPTGGGENAPDSGATAGSCDGFDGGQTGITDTSITLANASDISGPVPGIFESARLGARAYVAYFNATEKLCGRTVELLELDTRADAGADQQAYAKACDEAFGAIGSMSAFDSGGAATAASCGLPDLRSTTVNPERAKCSTCFAAQSVDPGLVPTAWPSYFVKNHGGAAKKAAILYIKAGAAPVNAESFRRGYEKSGWDVVYFTGIEVAEFNFAPYVQQMEDEGVELVYYLGPLQNTVKLQQAMQQQGFEPDVYVQDSTIYDSDYVEQAGALAEGAYAYTNIALFDDASNKEMQLYRAWLDQVAPGSSPNFYGLFAWSAARLFLTKAVELGGELTRASMVGELRTVKAWTSNGVHAPQEVGAGTTGKCHRIIQYSGGAWKQVSPGDYLCGSVVSTGVGG